MSDVARGDSVAPRSGGLFTGKGGAHPSGLDRPPGRGDNDRHRGEGNRRPDMSRSLLNILLAFPLLPLLPAQGRRLVGRPFATRSVVLARGGMAATGHPLAGLVSKAYPGLFTRLLLQTRIYPPLRASSGLASSTCCQTRLWGSALRVPAASGHLRVFATDLMNNPGWRLTLLRDHPRAAGHARRPALFRGPPLFSAAR